MWRAVTELEELKAWFPRRIVGDWRVRAPLRFESDFGDFDGEVLAFEPPSLIELRWGTDTIRLEIAQIRMAACSRCSIASTSAARARSPPSLYGCPFEWSHRLCRTANGPLE